MVEPVTAAAVGSAAVSAANGVAGWFSGKKSQERAYEYNREMQREQAKYNAAAQHQAFEENKKLAEYAYDREREQWRLENQKNLEFWNMQNAYNSPQAQMERYQAAGLNPNLIYGQENTAGDLSAASSPSYDTPTMQAAQMSGSAGVSDSQRLNFGDPISEYYQVSMMNEQIQNAKAQNEVLKSQAFKNTMDGLRQQAGQPYWSQNAQFDNLAKKLGNDILGGKLAALLYENENLLPLKKEGMEKLNNLRSQQYDFMENANPLRIEEIQQRLHLIGRQIKSYDQLYNIRDLQYHFDNAYKGWIENGEFSDQTGRRALIEILRYLFR